MIVDVSVVCRYFRAFIVIVEVSVDDGSSRVVVIVDVSVVVDVSAELL